MTRTGSKGVGTTLLAALIAGALGSCSRQTVELGEAHRLPRPEQLTLPAPGPAVSRSDTITELSMRNVLFHVDDEVRMNVHRLRGRMRALDGSHIVSFDDKQGTEVDVAAAEIALTSRTLSILLNRYVFGFKGSPIHDLVVKTDGDQIVQTGTMHKLIDIPFKMRAQLSVDTTGWIRIHPTKVEICNLDGQKLLAAVGSSLEKLLDLKGAVGVKATGNDLLINPMLTLPPPKIVGRMTAIRIEGDDIVQTFGAASDNLLPATPSPAANYLYFHGGTIKFGKLYMVASDLMTVDGDPTDPFDFYMDYYHTMLVAGYHVTLPNYGLITYMPDFDDIGTERGRIVAPGALGLNRERGAGSGY